MYFSKKTILLSALMVIFGLGMLSNKAQAQEKEAPTGKLYGKVVEASSGQAVTDIKVKLKNSDQAKTTGKKGMYAFKDLEPGTYTVKVKADEYKNWKQKVEITEKGKQLNIELKSSQG
ncbi:MAG: PEGA domain-containing protein [Aliifodinibius sp.]|nr:PEGA domain-containing protein [Fodinibius sp.]